MSLKEEMINYIPVNEQEEKDKDFILKAMENYDDFLTRNNEVLHFTSSAWVVNKNRDKVVMIYHNIYNSWGWTGGHADGEEDLLGVAKREVEEETSLKNIKVLNDGKIMALDVLPCAGHFKRGKYVSSHIHISVAYIFEADENEKMKIKEDENSNVAWQPINEAVNLSTEPHMKPVYQKLINRIYQMK